MVRKNSDTIQTRITMQHYVRNCVCCMVFHKISLSGQYFHKFRTINLFFTKFLSTKPFVYDRREQ